MKEFFDYNALLIGFKYIELDYLHSVVSQYFKRVEAIVEFDSAKEELARDKAFEIKLAVVKADIKHFKVFDCVEQIKNLRKDIAIAIVVPERYDGAFERLIQVDKKNAFLIQKFTSKQFYDSICEAFRKMEKNQKKSKIKHLLTQHKKALYEVAQIAKVDLSGTIKYANHFMEKIFGYKRGELAGYYVSVIIQEDLNPNALSEAFKAASENSIWKGIVTSRRKDGELIYGNTIIFPISLPNGEIVEYLLIRHDISDFVRESKSAKKSEQAKDAFLANMSHEIRTPLNAIIGYAELLRRVDMPNMAKEYAEIISKSGASLLNIVNQILDLSKIQNGHLELFPTWFDAKEEFASVEKMFLLSAEEKKINFTFWQDPKIPTYIYGDPIRIKQVLINLIGNAFKFTSSKITVKICLMQLEEDETSILFSIVDDGIGISKARQKQIFKPFTQEDVSTTKKYGGTGIGLSISSELLSMMGSTIMLKSKKWQGCEFSFLLQLQHKNQCELKMQNNLQKKAQIYCAQENVIALVAEDNEINQLLIKEMLSIFGVKVVCAHNGEKAVEEYMNNSFDIIFMDIDMPIMDGFSATKKILLYEKEYGLLHTPIVALTANVIIGEKQKCFECGMDDYLGKPFEIFDLEQILRRNTKQMKNTLNEATMINVDLISRSLGVDEDMITKSIEKFLFAIRDILPILEDKINAQEYLEASSYAHKFKGTAGLLGFDVISERLRQIEEESLKLNRGDQKNREYNFSSDLEFIRKWAFRVDANLRYDEKTL